VAESGSPKLASRAAVVLGAILLESGDRAGAREAFQRALEGGDPEQAGYAAANLGRMAHHDGQAEQAEALLRRGAEAGVGSAVLDLAEVLAKSGRWAEAEPLFRQAVALGVPKSLLSLGALLLRLGHEQEAEDCLRRALAQGDGRAVADLGGLLLRRCCRPEDLDVVQRMGLDTQDYGVQALPLTSSPAQIMSSDSSTDPGHAATMVRPLPPSPDLEEAESLLRQGVAAGYRTAVINLAALLCATRRMDEAEELLRPGAAAGDVDAMAGLVSALIQRHLAAGSEEYLFDPELRALLERCAQTGDPRALLRLSGVYDSLGQNDEALECLRKAAATGNVTGQTTFLFCLLDRGLIGQAHDLVVEILADPDLRALDAIEMYLAGPPPAEAALTALRRVRETRDVDAFFSAMREV
jgi:tetratricopeptide (TPR) repeat protein